MRNAIIPEHLSFVLLKSNPTPDIEQREREREKEKIPQLKKSLPKTKFKNKIICLNINFLKL